MAELEFKSLLDWEKPNYQRIWDLQKNLVSAVATRHSPETVLFCEHESVVTLGRRSHATNVLSKDLPQFEIERGGDVTYHGPGQLVIYPILRLSGEIFPRGLHEYLRMLEEVIIQALHEFHLDAGRFGPTGVWVRQKRSMTVRKIASIGVAVRRWVTYHGAALNISNAISDFSSIRPCDFDSSIMTSMQVEGVSVNLKEMEERISSILQAHCPGARTRKEFGGSDHFVQRSSQLLADRLN